MTKFTPTLKELREHADRSRAEANRLLSAALRIPDGVECLAISKAVDAIITATVLEIELTVKTKPLQ